MLQNTSATVAFKGWQSASFSEQSGVQQGNPLSPLFYVLAAQPLASHLRHQAQQAVIRPINMGTPLPVASSPRADMPDAASPLAGKRRGTESISDAESSGTAEAPSADSLAMVPLTPDDSHAPNLRRSSREHKKPRPYYEGSQAEPPDKPSTSKGLQRGFLK